MPWSEITPMDERLQFVADVRRGSEEMTVLCRRYGVSRKTGYKWLDRYEASGPGGLAERSHRLFRAHGLPTRLRSDNGVPFATIALGRLSALSVWWVRLGILPDLIEPRSPQQNGRHERRHRTLKAEATKPPEAHARAQQRRSNAFRREYNDERPHEALGQATPASRDAASSRPYPERLLPLEYPAPCEVRRVSRNGGIRWHNHWVNVSHVLAEEYIAFEEIDDGVWSVAFGPLVLGRFHERTLRIVDANGYTSRNPHRV